MPEQNMKEWQIEHLERWLPKVLMYFKRNFPTAAIKAVDSATSTPSGFAMLEQTSARNWQGVANIAEIALEGDNLEAGVNYQFIDSLFYANVKLNHVEKAKSALGKLEELIAKEPARYNLTYMAGHLELGDKLFTEEELAHYSDDFQRIRQKAFSKDFNSALKDANAEELAYFTQYIFSQYKMELVDFADSSDSLEWQEVISRETEQGNFAVCWFMRNQSSQRIHPSLKAKADTLIKKLFETIKSHDELCYFGNLMINYEAKVVPKLPRTAIYTSVYGPQYETSMPREQQMYLKEYEAKVGNDKKKQLNSILSELYNPIGEKLAS